MASPYAKYILGPVEIGVIITAFLFGCAVIQTYVYYSRFPEDPRKFKTLVAAVIAFEFAHLASTISAFWTISVIEFGNELVVLPLGGDLAVFFTTPICFTVQAFFTFRMWRLSNTLLLPLFCLTLSILVFISGLTLTGAAVGMTNLAEFEQTRSWLITSSNVLAAVCDTSITLGLAYFLKQKRSLSLTPTANIIDLLILWTVETGLVTALTALLVAICFLTMSSNFIWIGIYAFMGSVYANSLLAALNGRWITRRYDTGDAIQLDQRRSSLVLNPTPIIISVSQAIEQSSSETDVKATSQGHAISSSESIDV
ncbi:hypothetical protein HYDPIDRAFT_107117 [Hydnomerulius pinastri MD-312]|nr:hypothetical protein HYDPIDRAFT_107117 [Hydnomerulius pinastri MD-312]